MNKQELPKTATDPNMDNPWDWLVAQVKPTSLQVKQTPTFFKTETLKITLFCDNQTSHEGPRTELGVPNMDSISSVLVTEVDLGCRAKPVYLGKVFFDQLD